MAYGKIKADTLVYDDNGDQEASVQTLANSANSIATNTANIAANTTAIAGKVGAASPNFSGTPVFTGDGASANGKLKVNNAANAQGVTLTYGSTTDYTLTLPSSAGSANEFLQTDGNGALSWSAVDLTSKADINGPTFTGVPALTTTPADTTNDQTIADCQFVGARINKLEQTWTEINGATNLVAFTQYLCDSTASVFTITLPSSPTLGDVITIADKTGQFNTNNVTVARNGNNINGVVADLVLDVDRSVLRLIWSGNATTGWLVK